MSKNVKIAIGLIVVALVILGIAQSQKNKKQTQTKMESGSYKIGVILPLTGDAAVIGEPIRDAYLLAQEEINKTGKIKVELIIEDGKCSGKDATSAVQKLVNVDKVQVIAGGACSGESLAAIPIAEKTKVVMLSAASTNPKLAGISPYFFRTAPNDNAQGKALAEIANKKNYKKVAVLVEQTDYALGLFGVFEKNFTNSGGEIVKEEYKSETPDFKTQLTKLRAQNPDALFIDAQSTSPSVRILKQMADLNWKLPLFINEAQASDSKFVLEQKTGLEGAVGVEFKVDGTNNKFQNFLSNFKTKFGKEISLASFGAGAYDDLKLFAEGIQAVGYDGEKIAGWLKTVKDWEGATGKVTFLENGDSLSAYSPVVVKEGKLTPYTE
jgi:branched-chain amino acid transport system substrate-binding protein